MFRLNNVKSAAYKPIVDTPMHFTHVARGSATRPEKSSHGLQAASNLLHRTTRVAVATISGIKLIHSFINDQALTEIIHWTVNYGCSHLSISPVQLVFWLEQLVL